jgi:hypothetical protein
MVFGGFLNYSEENVLNTIIRLFMGNPVINQVLSLDFIQDALLNWTRFEVLVVVDNFTKKFLSLIFGQLLKGGNVRNELGNIELTTKKWTISQALMHLWLLNLW